MALSPFEKSKTVGSKATLRVPHIGVSVAEDTGMPGTMIVRPNVNLDKMTKDDLRDWASENLDDVWFDSKATKAEIKAGIEAAL